MCAGSAIKNSDFGAPGHVEQRGLVEEGLALGQYTLYVDITGGTYSYELRPEGIPDELHRIDDLPLKPSEVYTIFIVGNGDPNDDGNYSDSTIRHVLVVDQSFN